MKQRLCVPKLGGVDGSAVWVGGGWGSSPVTGLTMSIAVHIHTPLGSHCSHNTQWSQCYNTHRIRWLHRHFSNISERLGNVIMVYIDNANEEYEEVYEDYDDHRETTEYIYYDIGKLSLCSIVLQIISR